MAPSTVPGDVWFGGVEEQGKPPLCRQVQLCGSIALFSLGGHSHDPRCGSPKSPAVPGCCQKHQGRVLGKTKKGPEAEAVLSSAEVFPTLLWKVTSTKSLPKVGI